VASLMERISAITSGAVASASLARMLERRWNQERILTACGNTASMALISPPPNLGDDRCWHSQAPCDRVAEELDTTRLGFPVPNGQVQQVGKST
jgi:hypothetical protein